MQLAKLEANEAFKNIKLGDNVSRPAKRKSTDRQEINKDPKVRKLTRLEQARMDANKAFQNLPLGKEPIKRPVSKSKTLSSKENNASKRQRITKAEFIQKETMKSFGGRALDELQRQLVKSPVALTGRVEEEANTRDVAVGTTQTTAETVTVDIGTVVDDTATVTPSNGTVADSTVTVTVSSQVTDDTAAATPTATVSVNYQVLLGSKADMTSSTCMLETGIQTDATSSEESTEDSKTVRVDPEAVEVEANGTSKELVTTKQRLTRVERARLEALKSFGGQGLGEVYKTSTRKLAKYLTPKKSQATNTKHVETSTTPCQTDPLPTVSVVMATQKAVGPSGKTQRSLQNSEVGLSEASNMKRSAGRHPKPKTSLYSSIDTEASFGSLDALLETSRRVVQTAKMLETPP